MAGDAFALVGLAALGHALGLAVTIGIYRGLQKNARKHRTPSGGLAFKPSDGAAP